MADNKNFILKIITPERVFYEGEASMVEFNTNEGEIGVYKHHIPMTVFVKPGILTITGDEIKTAALHAGFAEILPEKITIMAEVIEWPNEIDLHRAEEAKERAEHRIHDKSTETDLAKAETALQRAVARINVLK